MLLASLPPFSSLERGPCCRSGTCQESSSAPTGASCTSSNQHSLLPQLWPLVELSSNRLTRRSGQSRRPAALCSKNISRSFLEPYFGLLVRTFGLLGAIEIAQ